MALVLVLATFVQIITPSLASATAASYLGPMNDKFYGVRLLRDCLAQKQNKQTIVEKDNSAMLVNDNSAMTGVDIGRWLEPDSGHVDCNNGDQIGKALSALGFNSIGDFLVKIGYGKASKTEQKCSGYDSAKVCTDVTTVTYTINGDDTANKLVDSIQQLDAAKFYMYQGIFNANCTLSTTVTGNGVAVTHKQVVEEPANSGKFITKDVPSEFPIGTETKRTPDPSNQYGFKTEQVPSKDANAKKAITKYNYNGQNTTCQELLSLLNGLADKVAKWNNANPENAVTSSTPTNDNADECNEQSPNWDAETKSCGKDEPTCTDQIKGIGWLICPTMEFLAEINDYAYGFLASNFLQTDTSLVKGAEAPWARFKDLANIAFVVALLFVIYSQITSVGISNYGIKKMLPKIIVAALLVNLSYIICQVAVDLSNILGYGISRFFTGIPIGSGMDTTSDEGMKALGLTLNWTGAVGAILVAGVGLAMALSFPVVLSALLAIAMIALILIARKALIVLLIVVAPLAFVAYLLPNTEQWFKKWAKLFSTLLLLFPIVGVVFGASALAAKIIATAAGAAKDPLMQLTALAISALPFFVVPGLLKGALNAAGAFGTKMQGWANGASKRMSSGASKKASERWGNTGIARGLAAGKAARTSARTARYARRINNGGPGSWGARAGAFMGGGAGGVDKLNQSAQAQADKDFEEDVKAVTSSFDPGKHDEIINMAKTGQGAKSDAERVAAIRYAAQKGGAGDVGAINSKGTSARVRSAHVDAVKEKKLNNVIGNKQLTDIAKNGMNAAEFDDKVVDAANQGIISGATLAQSDSTPGLIAGAVKRNKAAALQGGSAKRLTADGLQNLQDASDDAHTSPGTRTSMTKQMDADLNEIGVTTTPKNP